MFPRGLKNIGAMDIALGSEAPIYTHWHAWDSPYAEETFFDRYSGLINVEKAEFEKKMVKTEVCIFFSKNNGLETVIRNETFKKHHLE